MAITKRIDKLKRAAASIALVISFVVLTEKSNASLLDTLSGSPISSIPCSSCSQRESFDFQTTLHQPFFVTSAVWSADGKYLSIGSEFERNINVYDTSNWEVISHFMRDGAAGNNNSVIQFDNADDSLMVPRITTPSNEDVSIEKWSLTSNISLRKYFAILPQNGTLRPVFDISGSRPAAIAVSSSGNLLASSIGDSAGAYISIFNQENDRIFDTITCEPRSVPEALAFNPDSSILIVGGCHLYDVEGYNVQTGHMIFQTQVDPGNWLYNFISYNESGGLIAVGSSDSGSGKVTILKSADGSIVEILPRELATITNMQWLNDHLLLVSYDAWHPDGSTARVWDINSQSVVAAFGGKHLELTSVSPDGHRLAAVIGNNVIIGDLH